MSQKFLTADVYEISIDKNKRVALLLLQEWIPKLSKDEKTALVLLLINSYSVGLGCRWVSLVANSPGFSEGLSTVSLQISVLPRFLQLAIAIELLEAEREREK